VNDVILPDVQATNPDVQISLTKVGITEVKKMVEIKRGEKRPIILIPTFDIFVDLPSDRKGANLSRNLEVIDKTLEDALKKPIYAIEDLCVDVCKDLLVRHEYASRAEVHMKGDYMMKRHSPATHLECQEVYDICGDAVVTRDGVVNKGIGARVVAMTACPCAEDIMKAEAEQKLIRLGIEQAKIDEFLAEMPMPTHNQRGVGSIQIEFVESVSDSPEHNKISIESIIDIIENSMSSPMYELLKREDERYVVFNAHKNPKFVEDCVRTMAKNLVQRFPNMGKDSIVTIKQVNEESIHRHNAFAERIATFGELKNEMTVKSPKLSAVKESEKACKKAKAY
jgi:GTP cyclohydrolase-4